MFQLHQWISWYRPHPSKYQVSQLTLHKLHIFGAAHSEGKVDVVAGSAAVTEHRYLPVPMLGVHVEPGTTIGIQVVETPQKYESQKHLNPPYLEPISEGLCPVSRKDPWVGRWYFLEGQRRETKQVMKLPPTPPISHTSRDCDW